MRKYYKYEYTEWIQPTLSANGTVGGNSFAVASNKETQAGSDPYRTWEAFDAESNETYWRSGTSTGWIEFYNPTPIKVTNLYWWIYHSYPTGGNVQASNDGTNWTALTTFTQSVEDSFNIDLSNNTEFYNYYRVNITGVNKDVIHCKTLRITAQERNVVNGTSSDYDFYRDIDIYKLPCKKFVKRLYYDYTKPWEQPVCSSNTSHGTFTGGGYFSEGSGDRAYYHVSDNSWPTSPIGGGWDGTCWGTTHSASGWFNWELPETIRITGIKVMARNYSQSSSDYVVSNARFYTASDKVTPIGDTFNLTTCGQQLDIVNIPEDGILTNNIYFYKGGGGEYSGFAEIWITAYTLQEISASEYEQGTAFAYYTDINTYDTKGFKYKDGLKYYKYEYDTWTQPTLTSNTSYGVISSDKTTWSDSPVYKISDNTFGSSKFGCETSTGAIVYWRLPVKIKADAIEFYQAEDYLNRFPKTITVYGYNNGNYVNLGSASGYSQPTSGGKVTVTLINTEAYSSYKIEFGNSWGGTQLAVCEMKFITPLVQTIIESDSSDYDFYLPYVRNYYKYSNKINATKVGSPTITGTVANNFSTSDYFELPTNYLQDGNTFIVKIRIADSDTLCTFFNSYSCVTMDISDGVISTYNNGSSSMYTIASCEANTWYWIKIYLNNKTKYCSYSLDGETWVDAGSSTDSSIVFGSPIRFGCGVDSASNNYGTSASWIAEQVCTGDIDFSGCRIERDGKVLWNGLERIKGTSSDYDYYEDILGYRYKALKF